MPVSGTYESQELGAGLNDGQTMRPVVPKSTFEGGLHDLCLSACPPAFNKYCGRQDFAGFAGRLDKRKYCRAPQPLCPGGGGGTCHWRVSSPPKGRTSSEHLQSEGRADVYVGVLDLRVQGKNPTILGVVVLLTLPLRKQLPV